MNRIALVDDEKNIRETIRFALERENYEVSEYANGEDAWAAFGSGFPDCVVLDIMMPRMDGMELCRRIRAAASDVPIIFLSSRDDEIDRVLGLEAGGDDYVCKPFGMRELTARVRAALRRVRRRAETPDGSTPASAMRASAPQAAAPNAFPFVRGPLEMDEDRDLARWKGRDLPLTVTEFRILASLAESPGRVRTREQLMRTAFPEDAFPNERAADSHIKRIRRKLVSADPDFDGLEAIYSLGYRLRLPE